MVNEAELKGLAGLAKKLLSGIDRGQKQANEFIFHTLEDGTDLIIRGPKAQAMRAAEEGSSGAFKKFRELYSKALADGNEAALAELDELAKHFDGFHDAGTAFLKAIKDKMGIVDKPIVISTKTHINADGSHIVTETTRNGQVVGTEMRGELDALAQQMRTLGQAGRDARALAAAAMEDGSKAAIATARKNGGEGAAIDVVRGQVRGLKDAIPRLKFIKVLIKGPFRDKDLIRAYRQLEKAVGNAHTAEEAQATFKAFLETAPLKTHEVNAAERMGNNLGHYSNEVHEGIGGFFRRSRTEHQASLAGKDAHVDSKLEISVGRRLRDSLVPFSRVVPKISKAIRHVEGRLNGIAARLGGIHSQESLSTVMTEARKALGAFHGMGKGEAIAVEDLHAILKKRGVNVELDELTAACNFGSGEKTLEKETVDVISGAMRSLMRDTGDQVRDLGKRLVSTLEDATGRKGISQENASDALEIIKHMDHMSDHFPHKIWRPSAHPYFTKVEGGRVINLNDGNHHIALLERFVSPRFPTPVHESKAAKILAERATQPIPPSVNVAPAVGSHLDRVGGSKSAELNGGHVAALAAAGAGGVLIGSAVSNGRR